jgi:hypothetical protein
MTSQAQGISVAGFLDVTEQRFMLADLVDGAGECGAEAGKVSAAIENVGDDVDVVTGLSGASGSPCPVHRLISMFAPRHLSPPPVRSEIRHFTIPPLSMWWARSLATYPVM